VSDVRNIVRAHQISLKWFCSLTTSRDFIYLYIKAFPEQAAFIFKAFFLQFFLIESPCTSNEGCVRLIMSKVSRKVCHRIEFLDIRAWMFEPYFVALQPHNRSYSVAQFL
jgi:hypothetical protein